MAKKLGVTDIMDAIEGLSVLELNELVEGLQEKFGVSAAMPVAAAPAGGAGAAAAEEAEEKTDFTVILSAVAPDKKIKALKEIRSITGLGLKEAKELIDNLPKPVKEGIEKEEADKIKGILEGVGATVEVK
jgi:large subunit ribosomal protein L7/L12